MFLAFVIDLFSRRVWAGSSRRTLRPDLVLDALRMALASAGPVPTRSR